MQHSDWSFVKRIEDALGGTLFAKIRYSFIGQLIDLAPKMKAKKMSSLPYAAKSQDQMFNSLI